MLLAAGASQRFGGNKLLYPYRFNGRELPLIAHALVPWLQTFTQVTIVVRPGAMELRQAVESAFPDEAVSAVRWVECANAGRGMSASLACGVLSTRDAAGWLIGLADMPAVPVGAIAAVHEAIAAGAPLAAPHFNGQRGHPVGFSQAYRDALLAQQGDYGARDLLYRDADKLHRIAIMHAGILRDIDTRADLNDNLPLQEKPAQ